MYDGVVVMIVMYVREGRMRRRMRRIGIVTIHRPIL